MFSRSCLCCRFACRKSILGMVNLWCYECRGPNQTWFGVLNLNLSYLLEDRILNVDACLISWVCKQAWQLGATLYQSIMATCATGRLIISWLWLAQMVVVQAKSASRGHLCSYFLATFTYNHLANLNKSC